ncbi:AAA family ATPase [Hansschlegelia sp. KR7-227]|uniref:AAA family ATPase n=1 Tax=Hansschlegelia sp. KR7-227 TaxID=3400914 RepID=UPI003C036783
MHGCHKRDYLKSSLGIITMKAYDLWSPDPFSGRALSFSTPSDFAARPAREFIVDGLFALDEVSVVFGAPEAGKSNFVTDLCCRAASAMPWFGRPTGDLLYADGPAPIGVLYLALERTAQVERRICAFVHEHAVDFELPVAVCGAPIDLREPSAGDHIAASAWSAAERMRIGDYAPPVNLVVIDTLARGLAGGSDSDEAALSMMLHSVDRIRKHIGAHVLLVHHTPLADDARMRGHGSLNGAIDLSINVKRKAGGHFATVLKNSDGPDKSRFAFTLKNVDLPALKDGRVPCAPVVVPAEGNLAGLLNEPTEIEQAKPRALTVAQQGVLSALEAAIADADGVSVTEATWRARYDVDNASTDTAAAKKMRFRRGRETLVAEALIVTSGDGRWSVTAPR